MTARSPDYFSSYHGGGSLKQRTVRGSAVASVTEGIRFVLQLASVALLARLLAPSAFGTVAMATSITGVISVLKEAGLGLATLQRAVLTHELVSSIFWLNIALSVIGCACVAALSPAIAWFYGEPSLVAICMVLGLFMIIGGATAQHQAILRRRMHFRALGLIAIAGVIVSMSVSAFCAYRGLQAWALVSGIGAGELTVVTLSWTACRWRPGRPTWSSELREVVAFGGAMTAARLMNYFARNGDNIIIGRQLGEGQLGIYTRAYALMLAPLSQLDAVLSGVLKPALFRVANDDARMCAIILRAQRLSVAFFGVGIAWIALYADALVPFLLGDQWGEVVPVFRVLAMVTILQVAARYPGWILESKGMGATIAKLAVVGSVFALASFLIGVRWGIIGVSSAFLVQSCFWNAILASHRDVRAVVPVFTMARALIPACVALAVVVALSFALRVIALDVPQWIQLSATLLCGFAVPLAFPAVRHDLRDARSALKGPALDGCAREGLAEGASAAEPPSAQEPLAGEKLP